MTQFYVVGGRQKPGNLEDIEDFHHYEAGVVARVDPESGRVEQCTEYVSPPELCAPEDPSVTFKTGTLDGHRLYVPTETELLVYETPSFEQAAHVSMPWLNDVHHVLPSADGSLLVSNTGLDMVLRLDLEGNVLEEWSVIDEDTWERFSRDVDYRRVFSTKPHKAHPNHVTLLDDELWVTRCNRGDFHCLTSDRAPVPVADKPIHDGRLVDGRVYFTAVDGQVIEVDATSLTVSRRFDLNRISGVDLPIDQDTGRNVPLGWCRGVAVLDRDHVVVGFSRLRPTKWKQYVHWVKHQLGASRIQLLPTRIVMYDLAKGEPLWEVDLEPAGMNVVFSIHRVPDE